MTEDAFDASLDAYLKQLGAFDEVACEAVSVSNRMIPRELRWVPAFTTRVFTRICIHLIALMSAAPYSRWSQKEFITWDYAVLAGHIRAIMEGYLFFRYLASSNGQETVEQAMRHQVLLYDCTMRLDRLAAILTGELKDQFRSEQNRIKNVLIANAHFNSLPKEQQLKLLEGRTMMLLSRDKLLDLVGLDKKEFYLLWDFASQYMHVLSLSFMLMEANGRGTGVENETERAYMIMALGYCLPLLRNATDMMVEWYPELAQFREGIQSKFSPGPKSNSPQV